MSPDLAAAHTARSFASGATLTEMGYLLAEVCTAILNWKAIAKSAPVGMSNDDLDAFVPALENEQMRVAMKLLGE